MHGVWNLGYEVVTWDLQNRQGHFGLLQPPSPLRKRIVDLVPKAPQRRAQDGVLPGKEEISRDRPYRGTSLIRNTPYPRTSIGP